MARAFEYPPLSPYLSVEDARGAIAFYAQAFGAEVVGDVVEWRGKVGHAHLRINGGDLEVSDWSPEHAEAIGTTPPLRLGGSTAFFNLGVDDVDAWYARAVKAGAKPIVAPGDEFFGRRAKVRDPWGHVWSFVSPPPADPQETAR
ncbi:MAG: VOC family protein [Caulobacteraceae bacterium]|nr:VOC family protein [Caulobacter sp.]